MRILAILLIANSIFFACKPGGGAASEGGSTPAADTTVLEQQVMALHDEAMPRLNEINHITDQIRKIRAGLPEDETGRRAVPNGMDQVFDALKLADQAMWDWMKAYGDTKATTKPENLVAFYQAELPKITKVKADIDKAIADAQEWINAYTPAQ